jgi:hypothetical protein
VAAPKLVKPRKLDAKKYDAFVNEIAGYGTSRDRVAQGYWGAFQAINWAELAALYYDDDIAARIVDTRVEHMLRRGFDIEEYADVESLEEQLEQLEFETKLGLAMTWARLFGGAALIIGADDGLDPQYPLLVDRVRGVRFVNVVDRRFIYPISYYADPTSPKFGEPVAKPRAKAVPPPAAA